GTRQLMRMSNPLFLSASLLLAAACADDLGGTAGSDLDLGTTDGQAVTAGICPGPSTVQGIDVSVWQGSINWAAVKNAGRRFGIARVSDGVGYIDPTFSGNWNAMKAVGMIRGAYQFFEPAQDAVAQANIVVSKVGHLGPGDLPVMLDLEVTGGQSRATITAKIHQWVNVVQAGTGKPPMIYTGAFFWDGYVQSHDFAGLPLVLAWYGTNCPGVPNAWHAWQFHQYSGSGSVSGVSGAVDLDVFNGSLAQLQAFAGGGAVGSDGCTATERADAAKFGCSCVDHHGAGGFCPGSGCTALETTNAAKFGCSCVDHHGAGGFCRGSGCTIKETNDCQAKGQGCSLHECTL
ncbi:MAG TPA: glycoside hydrolase family 25 protein, partial [Kofleriaceae bacterium]